MSELSSSDALCFLSLIFHFRRSSVVSYGPYSFVFLLQCTHSDSPLIPSTSSFGSSTHAVYCRAAVSQGDSPQRHTDAASV